MTWIFLSVCALASVAGFFFYWKSHAKHFVESGYVPPATSWFGEFGFAAFAYLLTFVTVGKVKVKGKAPVNGRVIFAGNHQLPCDFAMIRRASGRHFRMLTASDQLGGFFGVLAAAGGVISVAFGKKEDGALAQEACVRSVASEHLRIPIGLASLIWATMAAGFAFCISEDMGLLALVPVVLSLVVAGFAGSEPALGIFPQGSLLPDDPDFKELFRPGGVRIGKAASELCGEPVKIVPVGIYYERDPKKADWTHRYLAKSRSMFLGVRNPKAWNPIFKKNIEGMRSLDQDAVKRERKEIMRAYAKSNVTNYGGTVIVGEPILASDLPDDPIEAIAIVRARIVELVEQAKKA